jgi:hypothetical protein
MRKEDVCQKIDVTSFNFSPSIGALALALDLKLLTAIGNAKVVVSFPFQVRKFHVIAKG